MAGSANARNERPLIVWGAAAAVLVTYVFWSSAWRTTHGFISYYAAARLLIEGRLGPEAYDDAWFGQYVRAITGTDVLEIFIPNPPMMALMATPVAWLDPHAARPIWLLASLAAAVATAFALSRYRERIESPRPSMVMAIVLLNPAMFANLRTGQGYLFVFALLGGAGLLLIRRRDGWAGVLAGLAFACKSAGLPLLLMAAWMGRWRSVQAALVTVAITIVTTAALVDGGMWTRYPGAVREFVDRPAGSVTAYQTTLGLFRRLCVANPEWNPQPAMACEPFAFAIPALLLTGAVALSLYFARRSPAHLWVAAGLCLSELTLPTAAESHFMLFAAAVALVPLGAWPLGIFAVLYFVPLAVTAEAYTTGWSVLAAYPRLYAAWFLWALAMRAMLRYAPEADARAVRSAGTVDAR